jgi:flagellar biosynthesis protein FliR
VTAPLDALTGGGTTWLLATVRVGCALTLMTMLIGGVPRWLGAVLGAAVGGLVAASLPAPPTLPASDGAMLAAICYEAAAGAGLGLLAALPLLAASWAGALVDRGLTPAPNERTGRATYGLLLAAVFVGIDGPARLVRALALSYQAAPMADPHVVAPPPIGVVIASAASAAVQLALPILLAIVVVQVALAAAGRLDPGRVPITRVTATLALAALSVAIAVRLAAHLRQAWPG